MKTTLSTLIATLLVTAAATAAPSISASDVSEDTLKEIASDRQKASIESYEKAKAKAAEAREEEIKKAKEITSKNDAGMKRTIQRRHLNSMLPPCDREPETPRDPQRYHIRY